MSFSSFAARFVLSAFVCASLAGCSSDPEDPEYGFGETDMQNAIVGDWSGTMTLNGNMPTMFTLSLARIPAMQPACGSRTFNSPLCVEISSMMLDATLSTTDKVFDAVKLTGDFSVIGLQMTNGEINLSGAGVNLAGGIDMTKTSQTINVFGDKQGTATMQR